MSSTTDPTVEVNIRVAKFSEIYQCAHVLATSFFDDVLFGRHIHPHRSKYPDDVPLFFYRMMQSEFWDWTMVFLISTEKDKNGRDVVTGLAQWHRLGKDCRRHGWGLAPWDPRKLLEPVFHLYAMVAARIHPNRAVDPAEADILVRSDPFTRDVWRGERQDRWYLHFLGVHPDHQNKGIGRRLVRWGIEQAAREGVGASVIAAYGKDRFYERCGFRETLGRAGQGEGNPLGPIPGGTIWWVGPGDEDKGDGQRADVKV